MTDQPWPADVEALRLRTREFVRGTVISAEPAPGERLAPETRAELQRKAKDAGVFAPHVSTRYGGQGVPIEHWSPIFQEDDFLALSRPARSGRASA